MNQQLQSSTIDLLRFPLILMVIFIHMNPHVNNILTTSYPLFSLQGIYNVMGISFSHVIPSIAVPIFFMISGFCFFYNFKEWSWDGYKKKIHSRTQTLLIPYILWNITPFILKVAAMLAGVYLLGHNMDEVITFVQTNSWHIFYNCNTWQSSQVNWLGETIPMAAPYDVPLWFLRDLIIASILTPIIYIAIKKPKVFILFILFIAYISKVWVQLPGFQISTFFYFTLGAYFALNSINIVSFTNKYKLILIPTTILTLILAIICDGDSTVFGQTIYTFFVLAGVFTAFYVASICITKYSMQPNKRLTSSCFFIYALHVSGIPILGSLSITLNVLHRIIPGDTITEDIICYIVSPFITAFLCILVLEIARRYFPKTTKLFSGNK